ncbi:hypothetical protein [Calditerricola satsumensis]|nr:hypothetical protein [Calditerricola satsumensis]
MVPVLFRTDSAGANRQRPSSSVKRWGSKPTTHSLPIRVCGTVN